MQWRHFGQRRFGRGTARLGQRATGAEAAAAGQRRGAGHVTLQQLALAAVAVVRLERTADGGWHGVHDVVLRPDP